MRVDRPAVRQRLEESRGAEGLQARGVLMFVYSTPETSFGDFLADCPEYVNMPTFGAKISNAISGSTMLARAAELAARVQQGGGGLVLGGSGGGAEEGGGGEAALLGEPLRNMLRLKAIWGKRLLAGTLLMVRHPVCGRMALVQPLLGAACMARLTNWAPELDPVFEVLLRAGASPRVRNSLNMTPLMLLAVALANEVGSTVFLQSSSNSRSVSGADPASATPGGEGCVLSGSFAETARQAGVAARLLLSAGANPRSVMIGFGPRWATMSEAEKDAALPRFVRPAKEVLHMESYTAHVAFQHMMAPHRKLLAAAGWEVQEALVEFEELLRGPQLEVEEPPTPAPIRLQPKAGQPGQQQQGQQQQQQQGAQKQGLQPPLTLGPGHRLGSFVGPVAEEPSVSMGTRTSATRPMGHRSLGHRSVGQRSMGHRSMARRKRVQLVLPPEEELRGQGGQTRRQAANSDPSVLSSRKDGEGGGGGDKTSEDGSVHRGASALALLRQHSVNPVPVPRGVTWPWVQAMSNIAWAVSQVTMAPTAAARRSLLGQLVRQAPFELPGMAVVSVQQLRSQGRIPKYSTRPDTAPSHDADLELDAEATGEQQQQQRRQQQPEIQQPAAPAAEREPFRPLSVGSLPPGSVVVFVSHRWLSRGSPDDEAGSKLKQVHAIIAQIAAIRGLQPEQVYLWLDYCVVDQSDPMPGAQALPIYIACCDEFVYVEHPEYWQRAWCLTEQFMAWKLAVGEHKHALHPASLALTPHSARERPPDPTYGKLAVEADRVALATMTSIMPYDGDD